MHRLLQALAASALFILPRPAAAQGTDHGTLRIALREDPDILDPTLSGTYVGRVVFAGLCDKLFDINEKLQIVPRLATGYEWADPTTLLIHLRPNVLFQDGEKLDAAAVKATLERDLTMPASLRKSEINSIDHIEIVDPLTVRIVLKHPSSPFLAQLTDRSGMILAPKAVEQEGKDFGLHPVCTGPFKFAERVPQDHITLDRFPEYWDASAIHFDRVVYRVLVDSSVRLANLKAGAVDLVEYVVPTDVAAVKADPKLRMVISDGLGYEGITANVDHGPRADTLFGKNKLVRQAFERTIDRKALIQVVYNGLYTPTAQAVPPSSPFFVPSIQPPPRDIAKAKELLAQAGVKPPVQVTLMVPNSPDVLQAAQVIQSMASEAGFDVKIQSTEFATSLQQSYQGNFEAYLIGWSGRIDIDGNTYAFLHSGQRDNVGNYSNAIVDQMLDQARTVTDIEQRQALYAKMWEQVRQDLPIIYLWTPKNTVGMTAKLTGFQPVPDGMIRLQGLQMEK
jgi:peptide/nickel transport system substrate-binding protein